MTGRDDELVQAIQEVLRAQASRLALDPASITSPSPTAIIGRRTDGALLRLDVTSYRPAELSQ